VVVFLLACVLLVGVALAYVVEPLRQPDQHGSTRSNADANVTVYRRLLAEMKSELADRLITADQFAREREELEDRLSLDLPRSSNVAIKHRPTPRTDPVIYLLAVGVPVAAASLYLALGDPGALG
jgi:cytochrome c-type biogenesis protein CcmI